MSLLKKFSLLCLVVMVAFAAGLSWTVTSSLERNALLRARSLTAKFVREEVENEISAADLQQPKVGVDHEVFARRVAHLSLGPDLFKVKVWNRDRVVVWTEDPRLVGRRFLDNHELEEALGGQVAAEFSQQEKAENVLDERLGPVLEIYVPVHVADGAAEAVFEVYQNLDPLYVDVGRQKKTVVWATVVATALVYGVLFGLVAGASGQLRRQTRELARSEDRLRKLIDAAQDGVVVMSCEGNILMANPTARGMFGLMDGERRTQGFPSLFVTEDRGAVSAALERLCAGSNRSGGERAELTGRRGGEASFPLEMSLSVSGEGGERVVTAFLRDVSERRAMQEQLIQGERQATASLVASSIGHELNNSITALQGYAEMLAESPGDSLLADRCARVFVAQSQSLAAHAMNLLELGTPREPRLEPIRVNEFLETVTAVLRESGILKRFELVTEYDAHLPPVLGDRGLLEQVVRNLEINAAHAMGDNGTLTLSTAAEDGFVRISVADTGPGIPPELLPEIFEPFRTTKGEGEGTGLGLYVARSIAEQHGGTLGAGGATGAGAVFTLRLPSPTSFGG